MVKSAEEDDPTIGLTLSEIGRKLVPIAKGVGVGRKLRLFDIRTTSVVPIASATDRTCLEIGHRVKP